MKMTRLAHDETPFLSAMQLRVTALAWWPDDDDVISLYIHGHDRSARDETSYPSTHVSSKSLLYYGSPLFKDKRFIAFLGDPWTKHLEGLYMYFIFYPKPTPLDL
jgi:hypothetical protein